MSATPFDPSMLSQFTGTTQWYRHGLNRKVTYTEGVQYVAESAGAYWLLDEIALSQLTAAVQKEEFQVWKLKLDEKGSGAQITVEDGNSVKVFEKHIDFTDFPAKEITLWFTDNVIMLPSEY